MSAGKWKPERYDPPGNDSEDKEFRRMDAYAKRVFDLLHNAFGEEDHNPEITWCPRKARAKVTGRFGEFEAASIAITLMPDGPKIFASDPKWDHGLSIRNAMIALKALHNFKNSDFKPEDGHDQAIIEVVQFMCNYLGSLWLLDQTESRELHEMRENL